jgi:tetratricopeptide (TPR) repeat protein
MRPKTLPQNHLPQNQLLADKFLAENQAEMAELMTFVDFAQGLTIGFLEINNSLDAVTLVQALRSRFESTIRFEVVDFTHDRDVRFLRDALVAKLAGIRLEPEQKLVVVIQGLETAIGTDGIGDYPPILQDLNFVRDSYRSTVPYPLLFVLPNYAITRVAKYAPDFWAWKSGVFTFKLSAEQLQERQVEAFDRPLPIVATADNQEQIDQLNQLLMEYRPSGQTIAPQNRRLCVEIYYKIGSAYLTQRQAPKAIDYLQEGLKLLASEPNQLLQQSLLRKLGNAYEQLRQFDRAEHSYKAALAIAKDTQRLDWVSIVLHDLADIALAQRQFEQAKDLYQQSLKINQDRNDRYEQASTYHQLGIVAQELREYDEARANYQQALQIKVEFNDRYSQASTYHQLGIVAQELREYDEARANYQQALKIQVEFNDRYGQASTYFMLGSLAEAEENPLEARANFQQALERYVEFRDDYWANETKRRIEQLAVRS